MVFDSACKSEPLPTIVEEYLKQYLHCKMHKPTTEYHNNRLRTKL